MLNSFSFLHSAWLRITCHLYCLLLCGCLFFLNGCSLLHSQTSSPSALDWKTRVTTLKQLHSFTLQSSASIQQTHKTDLVGVDWQQQQDHYQFTLSGPLGFGQVTVLGEPGSVTLTQNHKASVSAPTPEILLQNQLGWYVPISNLYYWVRGLPAPGSISKKSFDSDHRLSQLAQGDWQIMYLEYAPVHSIELPKKMEISSKDLKIRWVIRKWSIEE